MNYRAFKHFFDILNTFLEKSIVGKERFMTSNIDFWNEGLRTFHPICVVLLLFNKTLRGRGEMKYDLRSHRTTFILFRFSDLLTSLNYVLMDNFCPCSICISKTVGLGWKNVISLQFLNMSSSFIGCQHDWSKWHGILR